MKYFIDTEFVEDGTTIKLLSIAIVAEDGREFYRETPLAVDAMRHPYRFDPWLAANVIPHLGKQSGSAWWEGADLASAVKEFCDPETHGKPEFWGYYADYDWVAFCQLFGRMIDLPKGFPMYCRDLKQRADELGGIKLPKQESGEHHALADARWNRDSFAFLESKAQERAEQQ